MHWAVEYGDNFERHDIVIDETNGALLQDLSTKGSYRRSLSQIFLPEGYPHTVQPEYIEYQLWDTMQALSSYLRSIFTTKALLAGLGVGDAESTALAAALTWVLRDGVGMMGSLLFSFYFGATFDSHLKEWRLFADVSNDIGLTLDLAAPLVHESMFFPIIISATLFKCFCGVAAGSTKASITAHMAMKGNTADVAAKEGAQETLVTLIGMLFGIVCAHHVGDDTFIVWAFFILLTMVHVYANWRGVCALRLSTFNRHRFTTVLEERRKAQTALKPHDVAHLHSSAHVWSSLPARLEQERRIEIGVRISELCYEGRYNSSDIDTLRGETVPYIITYHPSKKTVRAAFTELEIQPLDELRCFLHALLVLEYLDKETGEGSDSMVSIISETRKQCKVQWDDLQETFKHWDLSKVSLGSKCWRYHFNHSTCSSLTAKTRNPKQHVE